jgi:hypothetical protein
MTSPSAVTLPIPANHIESIFLPFVRSRLHVANPFSIATSEDRAALKEEIRLARELMKRMHPIPAPAHSRIVNGGR